MDKVREFFARWVIALSDTVIVLSAFSVFMVNRSYDFGAIWALVACFSVILALDMFMVRREAGLTLYMILNGVLSISVGVCMNFLLALQEPSAGMRIMFGVLVFMPCVHAAVNATQQVQRKSLVNYFDIAVILEILFIASLGTSVSIPPQLVVLGLVSLAGLQVVLVSMRLRTGNEGSRFKRILGAAVMAVFVLLVCLLSYSASGALGTASQALVDGLAWVMTNLYRILMAVLLAFFNWLSNLFPEPTGYELPDLEETVNFNVRDSDIPEGSPVLFFVLFGILVAGVIIYFISRTRGKRLKGTSSMVRGGKRRRRRRLATGIGSFFSRILSSIRFAFAYITHRDSASGLFVWTELFYRRRGVLRRRSSTPAEFLRTVAASAAPAEARPGMLELASVLDLGYYNGTAMMLPSGFAVSYRKANRKSHLSLKQYMRNRRLFRLKGSLKG